MYMEEWIPFELFLGDDLVAALAICVYVCGCVLWVERHLLVQYMLKQGPPTNRLLFPA